MQKKTFNTKIENPIGSVFIEFLTEKQTKNRIGIRRKNIEKEKKQKRLYKKKSGKTRMQMLIFLSI